MKNCPACGAAASDEVLSCSNCDYSYLNLGSSLGAGRTPASQVDSLGWGGGKAEGAGKAERPTGAGPMQIGWACLVIAILALLVSFGIGPSDTDLALLGNPYAPTSVADVTRATLNQLMAQIAAGAFFSLFLILWSVGYIVNAISFLPGREDAPSN